MLSGDSLAKMSSSSDEMTSVSMGIRLGLVSMIFMPRWGCPVSCGSLFVPAKKQ